MGLKKYQEKRRFDETPEPRGKTARRAGKLRFVVQKHHATRLHYDFRLEMEGVLKSWAVPKGPSVNPSDKRLAVMVEDHPLDYRTFEGTIPEGNYGAGTVMVWDEGTYEPVEQGGHADDEQALRAGLAKGHIRFRLNGEKLQGQFSLVRTAAGNGKNWLLLKHRDAFASDEDITALDRSALSQRSMDEITAQAQDRGEVWQSSRAATKTRHSAPARAAVTVPSEAPAANMPHRVKPMLATLVAKPFDEPGWMFEVKWDGYRAIAEVEKGKVQLYSRRLLPFEGKYQPIVRALESLGHDAVLDGEVVVLDDKGQAQFELLQKYHQTGRGALVYYVFDLLYLDGKDLRKLPLADRKEFLAPLVQGLANVRVSEHVPDEGIAFLEAARSHGLEGIIAKRADSPYREGIRSQYWLKIKIRQQQEAVIGGFTQARGERDGFGAVVLGVYEGEDLVYIGHAGGGFNRKSLAEVHAKLEPLIQKECPFKVKPKTNMPVTWVKPALVCEIAFQNWTSDGITRMPIFLGLREDKPAQSVTREMPKPLTEILDGEPKMRGKKRSPRTAKGPRTNLPALPAGRFTNLDKIYWPEDGYTKGGLLTYYHTVAPFILPHLRDRPLSMNRHPNGIHGQSFFQKDVGKQRPPEFVETVKIDSETRGSAIEFLLCQNEPTLLYVANLGCIELNPWNSRVGSLENPDYLVIDLDPQDVPFPQVVEAAQAVRKLLEKGGAEGYCKTSGKRGLHIYVPLAARYDYDQCRQFAEVIAHLIHQQLPETTSVIRNPAVRRHKIYLDFLQNRRGQTMAAPYSVRPIEGARVSTPLAWNEVTRKLDPAKFTIRTVPRRVDKVGDLWQPVLGPGVDLAKCLAELT